MIGFLNKLSTDDNDETELLRHLYVHYRKLWHYKVRQIIQDSEAEDIIQQVFVAMIPKISFLKGLPPKQQLAYIAKALENAAKKQANFRNRVVVTEDIELYASEMADDPATLYDQHATIDELLRAMERLKPRQQDLLRYKFFERLSDDAIATLLNLQKASIRSATARLRRDLRAALDKERRNG